MLHVNIFNESNKPGWHNWLARETFNLKAVSSSLTSGDDSFFLLLSMQSYFCTSALRLGGEFSGPQHQIGNMAKVAKI